MENGLNRIAFATLSVLFLGINFVWLMLDRSPPTWDDANYLTGSLTMYDTLTEGGVLPFAKKSLTVTTLKPPLITIFPTPLYLVVGRHTRAARLLNLAFLFLTFIAVYSITKRYSDSRAGLIAVYVAGTMPAVYGFSRWYLTECALTAIVCICIWLMVEIEREYGIWKVALLGIACGLGLLLKASFPLYVAIPLLFFAWIGRSALRPPVILAFVLPAALLVLPWYLTNYRTALGTLFLAGGEQTAKLYGFGDAFSLNAGSRWLMSVVNAGPALYFVLLAVLLVAQLRKTNRVSTGGMLVCGLWALPAVFLALSHYRDIRWAAPLFPAAAVLIGILLDPWLKRVSIAGVACVLLAFPLVSMLQSSFNLFGNRPFDMRGLLLRREGFYYARPYDRVTWPHQDILADIARLHPIPEGGRDSLVVATDSLHFNADNFQLAANLRRLPFVISTTAYDMDRNILASHLREVSYIIRREGGERVSPYETYDSDLAKEVGESGRYVELPIARRLPDGGIARVYANLWNARFIESGVFVRSGADLEEAAHITPCNVTFGKQVQLTGFSLGRIDRGLRVMFRWQCLRPLEHTYRCFVHALDEHGNAMNLDHEILNDEPPLTAWRPGDVAIERLLIPFADLPRLKAYKLRFGLFRQATGDRLEVEASTLPLTDNQTAVLVIEDPSVSTLPK